MVIQSHSTKKAYLSAMRQNMSGHCEFGAERLTGFFLGPCFYVTYHSGYEWNRKYTNEKNAAMGFVTEAENGCEVRFIRFKGLLAPAQFLSVLLLMLIISPIIGFLKESTLGLSTHLIIAAVSVAIAAPIETFFESLTERSEEGRKALLSFLMDPADPYANYNKIP